MDSSKLVNNDTTVSLPTLFPVYDLLYQQVSAESEQKELTEEEILILTGKIKQLDKLGIDMVYVLIRVHSIRYSQTKLLDIPYKGEKVAERIEQNEICNDVKFDVREFPTILSRIITKFVDLHLRKMKEEVEKNIV